MNLKYEEETWEKMVILGGVRGMRRMGEQVVDKGQQSRGKAMEQPYGNLSSNPIKET